MNKSIRENRGLTRSQRTIQYHDAIPAAKPWENAPGMVPLTFGQRSIPIGRADDIEAGVKVPFWQGVAIGFFPGAAVWMVLGVSAGLARWPWWIVAVAGALVWFIISGACVFWFVKLRQEVLIQSERIERGNGGGIPAGPPPVALTVEVRHADGKNQTTQWLEFSIAPETLALVARGVLAGRPFSEREWSGRGRPLSPGEFVELRGYLLDRRYARWASDKDHRQGAELTLKGRALFEGLANLSPTAALAAEN